MSTAVESKESKRTQASTQRSEKAAPTTISPRLGRFGEEGKRTGWYIAGAVVFLAITGAVEFANRPAPIKEYGKVGQEFYPDFVDSTLASALEVYAFDKDDVRPREFRVERLDNGRWVIPSHHNYPADAEEQLAKTASSIIGITRGAMVSRWSADHARLGVVNPKQDTLNVDQVEGIGKRVILRQDDSVLADYVIGNKVEDSSNEYYVRHPDEDEVYIAELNIDLSTKFTDWIDTDLFDVSGSDIMEVTVNDYSFDELNAKVTTRAISTLMREKKWSDNWSLDGLDSDTQETDKDAIRETVNAIADLEIAGVRPKQQGLTPDLKLDRSKLSSQKDVDRLQTDLLTRGFLLQPSQNGDDSLRLIAREGELYAATDEGLVYRMHFGRVFTGSQEELEIGLTSGHDETVEQTENAAGGEGAEETGSTADEDADEDKAAGIETEDDATEEDVAAKDSKDSSKPGRYVFVRVDFDKRHLGDELVKPIEPEKPAELTEAESESASESKSDEGSTKADEKDVSTSDDEETADQAANEDGEESDDEAKDDPLAEVRKEYEEAKKKYDEDLRKYNEFQEKVDDGQKKAKEFSDRFADWYYVIPGASYEKLRLSRANLIKAKEKTDADAENKSPDADPESASSQGDAASVSDAAETPDSNGRVNDGEAVGPVAANGSEASTAEQVEQNGEFSSEIDASQTDSSSAPAEPNDSE